MVGITETAAQALEQVLESQSAPPDEAFRLSAAGEGEISLNQAKKEDGDLQLNNGERAVVFVEATVASALDNHTLDVVPAEGGMRLMVRPNEGETPAQ